MTTCYQGETQYLDFTILTSGGLPANILGATVAFSYLDHGVVKTKDVATVDNLVSVKFTPTETALMLGAYDYKLTITDTNADVDLLAIGTLEVKTG